MLNKTVVICLLARDSGTSLIRNIPKIERIRESFTKSYIVVVENDSKDNTKEILEEWKGKSEGITVLSEDTGTITIPKKSKDGIFPGMSSYRMEKMIFYRNKYLSYVKDQIPDVDYMIVIDSDIDGFDELEVEKAIVEAPKDWGALFANGRYYKNIFNKKLLFKYYDAYCYIPKDAENNDLTYEEIYLENDRLCSKLKKTLFVPCKSAFCGIGIYNFADIKDLDYHIIENKRSNVIEVLCDHVSLNLALSDRKALYIAKNMKVYYEQIRKKTDYIPNVFGNKFFISIWEILHRQEFFK